jgi:catecholate siderophore receptor
VRGSSGFWLNDANTGKVPRYAVWDATLAYVQRSYEVRLNVYNLGDETYYLGGYQNSPNRVLPGSPRTVALTVRYHLD